MKYFVSVLAAAVLCFAVCQSAAAGTFAGDTFLWFGAPSGGGGVFELLNGAYDADMSSTLFTGTAADDGSRNEYTLTGLTGFATPENTPFAVADLFYHNGRTLARSSVTSAPVNVDVHFSDPPGVDRTLTFSFDFALTLNSNDGPASADMLSPVDVYSTTTFFDGPDEYTLELLGFSDDGGTTILPQFVLAEKTNLTSTLYGRIVPPESGGFEPENDLPVPEPAGLGLIAAALLMLRKSRK